MEKESLKVTSFPERKPVQYVQEENSSLARSGRGGSTLGTTETRINGRYIVNDGTNDRVLIGSFT